MIQYAARVATEFANRHCPGSFEKYGAEWFRFYNQKFAELIVRECATTLETTDYTDIQPGANTVAEIAATDLRELFGVNDELAPSKAC